MFKAHVHCAHCARGPIKARHDALKHVWAQLCRHAGWHVTVEQTVTLNTQTENGNKKADLVAMSPGGCVYALDVIVTHGAPATSVHQALAAAEADKCRQYRVPAAGTALPGEEKFVPLVHHCMGMLGSAAFDFVNAVIKDIATKSAVAEGVQWQMAVSRTR
eukprot:2445747-Amphidinium_carterae.1